MREDGRNRGGHRGRWRGGGGKRWRETDGERRKRGREHGDGQGDLNFSMFFLFRE